jgi:hypothetical protein
VCQTSVGYLWQAVEKVVLVIISCGAEVEDLVAYMRDIQLTKYDFFFIKDIPLCFSSHNQTNSLLCQKHNNIM